MDRSRHPLWLILSFLVLLAAGCTGLGGPPPDIAYYAPEYDPPAIVTRGPLPVVLRVDRFGISPFYDATRIVYRDADFRRDAYVYHRWWANPSEMVPHFLARDLRATGGFNGVFVFDGPRTATHVLEGTIGGFHEHDTPDAWWAVLSVDIALVASNEPDVSRRVLLQRSYTEREPCDRKTPAALAAAMSRALARMSRAVLTDVYGRLESTRSPKEAP